MATVRNGRQAISKSIRFEVFKRDSFKCQYCGAEAPNVLLHIDHIKPVAKGGTNDITNLITACVACNSGKRDVPLDEHTAVTKGRAELEELQERREQLELMMQWRDGLRDLKDQTADRLADYWRDLTPGWSVNDNGKRNIKKWLQQFSVEEVTAAMDVAATTYLEFTKEGTVTQESWEQAFSKILGICRVNRASEKDPDLKQLYYIRGILRNRIPGYYDDAKALKYLKNARSWDVPIDELAEIARSIHNWSGFTSAIGEAIQYAKEQAGESENEP
jgi:hypothetical protein